MNQNLLRAFNSQKARLFDPRLLPISSTMAPPLHSHEYFNLTYPLPFVANVEINRPEKMNAFIEA